MKKTTIVVPCFNEAKRLKTNLFATFAKTNDVSFLFVNDGSTDGTRAMLDAAVAENPELAVLHLAKNAGKAEAVRQGMLWLLEKRKNEKSSLLEFAGFWDADTATPLDEINDFVAKIEDGPYDAVTGLRLMRLGNKVSRRRLRHYLGRVFATCVSEMLRVPVYDSQCGAKLFRISLVADLFGEPFITRWLFDVEILARYIKEFGREKTINNVHEHPVFEWQEVGDSRLKLKDFFTAPFELLKIFWKYRK